MSESSAQEDVPGHVWLYRRITRHHLKPVGDGLRVSSAAFQPSSDGSGVSIHLSDTMLEEGIAVEDLMTLPPEALGIAFVTTEQVRDPAIEHDVTRNPLPGDPSHGNIVGHGTDGRRKQMARLANEQWVIGPPEHL